MPLDGTGIEIPKDALKDFKSAKVVETPEQIAAREEQVRLAAAGGETEVEKLAREEAERNASKPPDLSLLEGADETLIQRIEEVGAKEEDALTEEEKKFIQNNLELVRAVANQEISPVLQLMEDEGYVEEGEYNNDLDGYKGYLGARDKVRDKTTITSFLDENPEVKALSEHLKANKPILTFLAKVQKPAVLNTALTPITEAMDENQKDALNSTYEEIIGANLRSNGMSKEIAQSVVAGAKANGSLYTMAQSSLKDMNTTYDNNIREEEDRVAKLQQGEADRQKDLDDKVTALVRTGKLANNISVPKSDEANFIKALTVPINDDGDRMIDKLYSNLSLEERAALDYIVFKRLKIPTASKTNVFQKYRLGKEANKGRTPLKVVTAGKSTSLGKLNLRRIAESQGTI